jgi:glutamine cyclotransferase
MQLFELLLAAFMLVAFVHPGSSVALTRKSNNDPVSYKLEVLRTFRHVGKPFTQGLEITSDGKHLVETSGAYPAGVESFVRIVDPITGDSVRSLTDGLTGFFAEGIVQMPDGHWFASTYVDHKMVEYSPDLQFVKHHAFPAMGWGLTRTPDGSAFLGTNGSEHLMTFHRGNFATVDTKVVTCMGKKVTGLNELELVHDFMGLGPTLLGNVYLSRLVLALDPVTAVCKGVFHLEGLGVPDVNEGAGYHAANGLAFNKSSGTLIATGKNWEDMFEVRPYVDASNEAVQMLSSFMAPTPMSFQVSAGADSFLDARQGH